MSMARTVPAGSVLAPEETDSSAFAILMVCIRVKG
jgi:hypothetical protein